MDVYGTLATDYFRIDDLLDLSDDQDPVSFSSSTPAYHHHIPPPENHSVQHLPSLDPSFSPALSSDFTDNLPVPSDEVAELEWLSQFVEDSFSDLPPNSSFTGTINVQSDSASFPNRVNTESFKGNPAWLEADQPPLVATRRSRVKEMPSKTAKLGVRRCTHCASEKTPQWRMGPLGPKTLCNACGVRYKSGRLVPEYRPAASPTFVLTQHSNSHRKVMELRRQKEMLRQQQQQKQDQKFYHHHQHFEVC